MSSPGQTAGRQQLQHVWLAKLKIGIWESSAWLCPSLSLEAAARQNPCSAPGRSHSPLTSDTQLAKSQHHPMTSTSRRQDLSGRAQELARSLAELRDFLSKSTAASTAVHPCRRDEAEFRSKNKRRIRPFARILRFNETFTGLPEIPTRKQHREGHRDKEKETKDKQEKRWLRPRASSYYLHNVTLNSKLCSPPFQPGKHGIFMFQFYQ
ncbi:unnamed protein product [Pleuronectes platessa]|uniref:Uncharacterized protein n=1 Tax=Pleuronectes platessa TaxID=8262 RepID=A0A9N7V678_PLEPL|nr:unnamed protein product [Pleuronectes platessa]